MPREITIVRRDGSPLGDIASGRGAVESALPGVRFFRDPSGLEKMAASGIEFPEALRHHLEGAPATTQADYEGKGYSIRFFLGAGPGIERLDGEVRGDGDPGPELCRLADLNGWMVLDADGSQVAP
jgi:hypothetical protein